MLTAEVIDILNTHFPRSLQEKYDNTGEQILFPRETVSGIMLCLDLDETILDEALLQKCNLLITHHPVFFRPLPRINVEEPLSSLVVKCIDNRISIFSIHTNLDKIFHDRLAEKLGFRNRRILLNEETGKDGVNTGFGSLVELPATMTLHELLEHVRRTLSTEYLIYSGDPGSHVRRLAVLNGAGGGSISQILEAHDVDCIITGDVTYHQARHCIGKGVAAIDAGHFGTEIILLEFLSQELVHCLTNIPRGKELRILTAVNDRNPFKIYP